MKFFLVILLTTFVSFANAEVVEYDLELNQENINIDSREVDARTINHSIPGPTIRANLGDFLKIHVKNNMDEESSIHWHGVILPPEMDGVPYVNSPPIKPGETLTYEFPIVHTGTYWYHAHSGFQEQQGIYGAIVLDDSNKIKEMNEHILVLSDWTDEDPEQVLANLKKDPDYYALKKDSVQSWDKVVLNGWDAIWIRLKNSFMQMGPMDLSDVGYDKFLINGKSQINLGNAKPGEEVKLRIINAGASSYFIVNFSGGPMKVVAADGMDVEPFDTQSLRIAMAETYDVIVKIPENKTYEIRANAEDGTGSASARIGQGPLVPNPPMPKPNLFVMDHMNHGDNSMENETKSSAANHDMNHTDMHHMDGNHSNMEMDHTSMNHMMNMGSDYENLKSTHSTSFDHKKPIMEKTLRLTGSMERYVWYVNNVPMYASDTIQIKKGEVVRFTLINETMMHHPIHVHGHFFRVINQHGDKSPLKHTVNVAPFETIVIEFEANESKDWIFHCHNLYHMNLGMGGFISYEDGHLIHESEHNRHGTDHGDRWFRYTEADIYSNLYLAKNTFNHRDHYMVTDWRHNWFDDYELDVTYQYAPPMISQFLKLFTGGEFEKEDGDQTNRVIFGASYMLPFMVDAEFRVGHNGKPRFQVGNDHQITKRFSFDWHWNTEREYMFAIHYKLLPQLELSANYDDREQFGFGISVRF